MIRKSNSDNLEGVYEEWVDVVEETNTVFDGDDANVSSKGGVLHTNYVYPDKVNLFTEKG